MGAILRFPRGGRIGGVVSGRATRAAEIKFRYPGPDVVSEVSCASERRPKRAAARASRETRLA